MDPEADSDNELFVDASEEMSDAHLNAKNPLKGNCKPFDQTDDATDNKDKLDEEAKEDMAVLMAQDSSDDDDTGIINEIVKSVETELKDSNNSNATNETPIFNENTSSNFTNPFPFDNSKTDCDKMFEQLTLNSSPNSSNCDNAQKQESEQINELDDGEPEKETDVDKTEIEIEEKIIKEKEALMTEEEKEALKEEAQALKTEGNEFFKNSEIEKAMEKYTQAILTCPLCFGKDRSIMYSNRAACYFRQEKHESCIKDCSKALEINPNYLKALLRRAESYEITEKLDEALADYQKALEMDGSLWKAREACVRLPDQIKERNEKMKEEMLGKLKDLGNMILKPFGLSTENFKFQQDPNSGSYSVNFQNQEPKDK